MASYNKSRAKNSNHWQHTVANETGDKATRLRPRRLSSYWQHLARQFPMDKFAYWTVQALKYPTYMFFQRRHMCHASVTRNRCSRARDGRRMLLHCKSLRRFEHSGRLDQSPPRSQLITMDASHDLHRANIEP
ncbi:hypothetical protein HAX54_018281 [Datura stramonium]|uniref:Uncharacterized protein n=1 Tax=Datura stramonium TaxID=4076 RepID=A0ABS8S3J2_DATST|nr:hypothetical protein [Datura stramonium]